MSKITNDGLNGSGCHSMLYSRTYMATVGVKGLMHGRESTNYFKESRLYVDEYIDIKTT